MKRNDIINKIIDEQKRIVANLENSVERYDHASDLDEDGTIDPDDLSQQTQSRDMLLRFTQLLDKAKNDLEYLITETDEEHNAIEEGVLIETDKAYIFIGISVPKFSAGDKDVYAISVEAPIYTNIRGKKVGDVVDFNQQEMKIISIA